MGSSRTRNSAVRWRSVALPVEHGGWAFIGEPVLLALLLAPGWGGFALGVAAFAAFLLRQPLKIYLKDVLSGRSVPRTHLARRFVFLYAGVMLAAGLIVLALLPSMLVLLPLLLALPLIGLQLVADVNSRSRALMAELAGATALGAVAASMVLMHGWALGPALGLWLALAVKAFTAVLYVRVRLRLERNKPVKRYGALAAHTVGCVILAGAAALNALPWTAPLAMVALLLRAVIGLSQLRKPRPARVIGMLEMAYGLGFVLLIALGYLL